VVSKDIIMKELRDCPKHGTTDFVFRPSGRYRCLKCAVDAVQNRRIKLKEMSVEYKGGKCEVCGYDKCKDALDFHHRDPSQKEFGIGVKGYTRAWAKVKEELDKCMLVCANCHRELHSTGE
jgi:hypothetical protein